jgi:hypothetical protein
MREQWMDTNLLLNGMQQQGDIGRRQSVPDHRAIHPAYHQNPILMHPLEMEMAYDDGYYDEGYDLPYDAALDHYDDELVHPQAQQELYYAEDPFSPIEQQRGMEFAHNAGYLQEVFADAPPAPQIQNEYMATHEPHNILEEPFRLEEYRDPVYQPLGVQPGVARVGDLLSPHSAMRQDFTTQEPMLNGFNAIMTEREPFDYAYPPFESSTRARQDNFTQVHPFLEHLGDEFCPSARPADIIAGRWAQEVQQNDWPTDNAGLTGTLHEQGIPAHDAGAAQLHGYDDGRAAAMFSSVDNNVLPSEGIDFGEQPRLFDEIWEQAPPIAPLDPDMEDYHQAVREQGELYMLATQ